MPPRSSTSSSNRAHTDALGRRTLRALLLALALFAIGDLGCRLVLPRSGAVTRFDSARAYFANAEVPDVQIVGDSIAYYGIIASAFAGDESIYVRNDALAGSLLPHSYYLLRRQIEANRAPRAFIIAHTPLGFGESGTGDLAASFLDGRELLEMAATEEWPTALYGALAKLSYVLMNRSSFKHAFMGGGYTFFVTPSENHLHRPVSDLRTIDVYRTNVSEDGSPDGFVASDMSAYLRMAKFQVSRETDAYLRKLLTLARQNGVQVLWTTTPVPRAGLEAMRATGYEHDLDAYLAQFERSGELVVLQRRFIGYDDSLFVDFIHPGSAVAVQFSCELRKLAGVLQARISDGPRVQLVAEPRFRSAALAEQGIARNELAEICEPAALSAAASID